MPWSYDHWFWIASSSTHHRTMALLDWGTVVKMDFGSWILYYWPLTHADLTQFCTEIIDETFRDECGRCIFAQCQIWDSVAIVKMQCNDSFKTMQLAINLISNQQGLLIIVPTFQSMSRRGQVHDEYVRYPDVPENWQNAGQHWNTLDSIGSSQDFYFLQNMRRNFFITIVFPEVKEFELRRR